ncbi:ABC transporter ATP-binding protein [Paenibacillus hamazuiensis]|uniref:ABC transporter ATP-binding protein n=1 Tax=Paenibacillus hamazuiensis TaxID=2936508 RepID=UPI00200CC253|nr:ABC transporter ATP-binding protein [Paenibacillus hamazuiensis]
MSSVIYSGSGSPTSKEPEPLRDEAKIAIRGVGKVFVADNRLTRALTETNVTVRDGEFLVIVGPSGCGKTTLLRILAGLEMPTSGEVRIEATDRSRPLHSMVFQERSIFPWMKVIDNVAYGLRVRGVNKRTALAKAEEYLGKVGLAKFAQAYPHELSGGMKQRVSIARAFANDPEVLLMDEPFAALDEQTKLILQEELLRIWDENKKTVVYVTHSLQEAVLLGDRILVFSAHPGRIKAEVQVSFPRPRSHRLTNTPEFSALTSRLWELLKDEVVKASGLAGYDKATTEGKEPTA